ncbi:MAG: hypothetical protein V1787_04825 [Candidatus Micrarchaeota archaeon]
MRGNTAAALAFMLALAASVAADVIYLHCPTVFTKSISTVKANYFKNLTEGGGPLPSCLGLNVSIDGRPALDTECVSPGLMSFNLSTPVAKTYTITGLSNDTPPWNGDGTTATCTVRRSSFNVNVTIPEFDLLLIPLIAGAGVLLIRRRG